MVKDEFSGSVSGAATAGREVGKDVATAGMGEGKATVTDGRETGIAAAAGKRAGVRSVGGSG